MKRELEDLIGRLNRLCETWLEEQHLALTSGEYVPIEKIVNDPLWGTIRLHPWETALVDSYLLQRLRHIRQLGVIHWVYPAAGHSRLEHSLGVVHQVQRLIDGLERTSGEAGRPIVPDETALLLRLAALLHDVGHTLLSHVSEPLVGELPGVRDLVEHVVEGVATEKLPSVSEAVAATFVTSPAFRKFLACPQLGADFISDVDDASRRIRGFILGEVTPGSEYLSQLVNGAFDADKLDYMPRDAMLAGIPCAVDVNRIAEKIACVTERRPDGSVARRYVSLCAHAVRTLEEIATTRSVLFEKAYFHHKVRALEIVARRVLSTQTKERGLSSLPDWMGLTDEFILGGGGGASSPLRTRRLLKRAVEIELPEYGGASSGEGWRRLRTDMRTGKLVEALVVGAREAAVALGLPALHEGVLAPAVDVPDVGRVGLGDHAFQGSDFTGLSQIDGTTNGGRPEAAKRVARHVAFVFAHPQDRLAVIVAARRLLPAIYGVQVPESAFGSSKVDPLVVAAAEERLERAGYYSKSTRPAEAAAPSIGARSHRERQVEGFLRSAWPRVSALAVEFGRFQSDHGEPISPARICDFLRQFETAERARTMLRLLEEIDFKDRKWFVGALQNAVEQATKTGTVGYLSPLGESGDSSALLTYMVNDLPPALRHDVLPLEMALRRRDEGAILLWDDFCGAGGHACTVLAQWLGEPKEKWPLRESLAYALESAARDEMRRRRLVLAFGMATRSGIDEVRRWLSDHGFDNASVIDPTIEVPQQATTFANGSFLAEEAARRDLEDFLRARMRQALAPKLTRLEAPWSNAKLEERLLGYGNGGHLIVFHYNVPTMTTSALWCEGPGWKPLFPRREKARV